MADNNKNLTVYQKLFYLFGQGHGGVKNNMTYNKYALDDKDLIVTKSRQDYEKEKLQLQQQKYLEGQWAKVDNELYQKAVFYETSRIASYMDFEAMEFTPEIAVALDIMSEESCLAGNTLIPLLNGENITIKELYEKNYTNFWVYGVKIDEDSIKPSIVDKVVYKGYKDVYKVILDDDTEIICTPDHKWLNTENKWVETKDLKHATALKSIYSKKTAKGYEKVSLNDHWSDYKLTHRIVADSILKEEKKSLLDNPRNDSQKIVIHHKSFNKLNNDPSELQYMFWDDHQKLHYELNSERWLNTEYSEKMKKIFSDTAKMTWSKLSPEERFIKRSSSMKNLISKLSLEDKKRIYGRKGENNGMYGSQRNGKLNPNYNHNKKHIEDINEDEYIKFISSIKGDRINPTTNYFNLTSQSVINFNKILCKKYNLQRIEDIDFVTNKEGYSITNMKNFIKNSKNPHREFKKYCNVNNLDYQVTRRFINKQGYSKWGDLIDNVDNHRVVSVDYVGKEDVYDLVNSSVDSTFGVKCENGMIVSHNCTLNEQGKILSIYSDSSRIKKVLEDLFFNVLDIHSNLPMWTRNTCKYGDNFLYLKIDYKDGIIGASQLTNINIERKESGLFPFQSLKDDTSQEPNASKKQVKFYWRDKSLEFNAWEIAHFRLLGDDRKLPYGTSVLEKVRRIWKQLLLAEDAMLVYRVTRAPERRVFKVYVGNIDDNDVEAYVQKVANKFKRTQKADRETGQVDLRYNTLAVDQDYFVPVRDPNASSPIETLAGASNLDQIADIQFIQRKMVTALRVPKTFLGFEEVVGDGKNLAMMDIRFARTINRIQQSIIQELNKIAIIHLYILGFHDELNNFKLVLNNPSTQGEVLKVEQWKEKVLLYKDLVSAIDGGIAPTSHTWAKRNIFNWSNDEILEDLEQQRLERAAAKELENTPEVIKNTGFFKKVDKLYGEISTGEETPSETEGEETGGGFGTEETGGGFGGGGFDIGGAETGGGEEALGGAEETGGGSEAGTGFGESFRGDENVIDRLLLEGKKKNEDIFNMTKGIDLLLNEENNEILDN
jgi:hypothetical protein